MSDPLLNDLSLSLLLITVCLGAYLKYFSRPSPLVHPLLLGKQSEVSQTRHQGQSGIYRSWATGNGSPLSLRPANSLKTIANILDLSCPTRHIYGTLISNDLLKLRAKNIAKGLVAALGFASSSSEAVTGGGVLNLLPDSFDSLLLTLAFAISPTASALPRLVQPTSLRLLNHILELPKQPRVIALPIKLLQVILEQLVEDANTHDATGVTLIVVGDDEGEVEHGVGLAKSHEIKAFGWRELERVGDGVPDDESRVRSAEEVLVEIVDEDTNGNARHTSLTHQSLTAGMSAVLSLFPAHKRPGPNSKDSIASCLSLSEPVGLTLALCTIWSGAAFKTFPKTGANQDEHDESVPRSSNPGASLSTLATSPGPLPTILFLDTPHLTTLVSALSSSARSSFLYTLARRHKLADLADGFIARSGVFERVLWSSGRARTLHGLTSNLRAAIVVGPTPTSDLLLEAQIHLGMPLTRLTHSPLSTSPLFVSHFYDVQHLPSAASAAPTGEGEAMKEFTFNPSSGVRRDLAAGGKNTVHQEVVIGGGGGGVQGGGRVHTGGPGSNVEVMLKGWTGEDEEDEGAGEMESEDPGGEVWVRGPGVVGGEKEGRDEKGFVSTGLHATVLKNGCFVVV